MPWNLSMVGTNAEVVAAVAALSGGNALENDVLPHVRAMIGSQISPSQGAKGALFLQGPYSLKTHGRITADSSVVHVELQVITLLTGNKIRSGEPAQVLGTVQNF